MAIARDLAERLDLSAAESTRPSPDIRDAHVLRIHMYRTMARTLRLWTSIVAIMALGVAGIALFFFVDGFTFGAALFALVSLILAVAAVRISAEPPPFRMPSSRL